MNKKITYPALFLALFLSSCNNKHADPLQPEQSLIEDINRITMPEVLLTKPKDVQTTDSKIEISPQTQAFYAALAAIDVDGKESESLKASATMFSSVLSQDQISELAESGKNAFDALSSGRELPASLLLILNKASESPELSVYMPVLLFPTVSGETISGLRTAAAASINKIERVQVSDICLQAAEDEFEKVKDKLDAQRSKLLSESTIQYDAQLKAYLEQQQACQTAVPLKYAALNAEGLKQYAALLAYLDKNQASLGSHYKVLKAELTLEFIAYFIALKLLAQADVKACSSKEKSCAANALSARMLNDSAIEQAYLTALAFALKLKTELAESCHNQGAGN